MRDQLGIKLLFLAIFMVESLHAAESQSSATTAPTVTADQDLTAEQYFQDALKFDGGVVRDDERAMALYTRAAELGHAQAMVNLAVFYEFGYRSSAELLPTDSIRAPKDLDGRETGASVMAPNDLNKDYQRAFDLYNAAVQKKNANAYYHLCRWYEDGFHCVSKDFGKAAKYLNRAARGGNASAEARIGLVYEFGQLGRDIDLDKALKAYDQAILQGEVFSRAMKARVEQKIEQANIEKSK